MGTLMLGRFLTKALSQKKSVRILEIGAGIGGTTEHILEQLTGHNIPFSYTFTDTSRSLVAQAGTRITVPNNIACIVLDIENPPSSEFGCYDIVIASNAIHATKDLLASSRNCFRLLKPGGILCLVELMRDLW
ncbi:S-adenosyl-L-methionine-dependent methyltransferase [Aspergillus venezuelensis]